MPKRKRTQRVEEESRRVFPEVLEERFLFRDEVPDNGIDGSVEEFDQNDQATGLRYSVQLKATDEEKLGTALKRSIPIGHAAYYNAHPLPILMVRYMANTGDLYVRWWHNPLPGKSAPKAEAKTFTFHWSEDDKFEESDSTRLAEEARGFLELRSSTLKLPVQMEPVVENPAWGLTPADVELALETAARERADVVEMKSAEANGKISIRGHGVEIELFGTLAASMELEGAYDPGDEAEQLAVDLMALTATALARWGQNDLAARMTSTFFPRSMLSRDPQAALLLSGAMTAARRVSDALKVAEEIDTTTEDSETNTSLLFTLVSRRHGVSLSAAEKAEYAAAIERRIERRDLDGEGIEASREMISLGNLHRYDQDGPKALELYERAAELDPDYLERAYYWRELGGVLFFCDRFSESADAYAKAIELGEEAWDEILRADALMFAGEYRKSREAFAEVIPGLQSIERGAEYPLKHVMLSHLVEEMGIESQVRDVSGAYEVMGEVLSMDRETEREAQEARSRIALELDALNPGAWSFLASIHEEDGDIAQAGRFLLFTSLCRPEVPQAWALSFLHLMSSGKDELLPLIVVTGNRMTGRRVLPEINQLIRGGPVDPADRDRMIRSLKKLVDDLADPRTDGFEMRIVGDEVTSVHVPGARTRDT